MTTNKNGGFTIIESLLFLAISASLIIIAISYIGGRNQVVKFQDSMRGLGQYIDQVYSYSANGTVLDSPNCSYTGVLGSGSGTYSFTSGNDHTCTVLGYVMELPDFNSEGSEGKNQIDTFPMFGTRQSNSMLLSCTAFQLECVEPIANPSQFDSYDLEWGSEIYAAYAPSTTVPLRVSAFGFLKLPSTGSIVPVAYFATDFKDSTNSVDQLHNTNVDSVVEGGTRQSAIGEEVTFIMCIEDAQNELKGSYGYSYTQTDASSGQVSFAGSDDYVTECDSL